MFLLEKLPRDTAQAADEPMGEGERGRERERTERMRWGEGRERQGKGRGRGGKGESEGKKEKGVEEGRKGEEGKGEWIGGMKFSSAVLFSCAMIPSSFQLAQVLVSC